MKLPVFLLTFLTFGGNNVIGEESGDEFPNWNMCKPPITQDELDSLNKLGKDIMISLNDLKSQMETDLSKNFVDQLKDKNLSILKFEDFISDQNDVEEVVDNLNTVVKTQSPGFSDNVRQFVKNEPDNNKWKDYKENVLPEFEKRLEPFMKYVE